MPDSPIFEIIRDAATRGVAPEVTGQTLAHILGVADKTVGDTYPSLEDFHADRDTATAVLDACIQALQDLKGAMVATTPETPMGVALGSIVGPVQAILSNGPSVSAVVASFMGSES